MSIKSKIENHLGIFFFGTLLTGFIAGVTCYSKSLELFRYEIITVEKKQELDEAKSERSILKDQVINLRIELSKLGKIKESEILTTINNLASEQRIKELELSEKHEKQQQKQKEVNTSQEEKPSETPKGNGMSMMYAIGVLLIIMVIFAIVGG